jgi:hypothetical protein
MSPQAALLAAGLSLFTAGAIATGPAHAEPPPVPAPATTPTSPAVSTGCGLTIDISITDRGITFSHVQTIGVGVALADGPSRICDLILRNPC